MDSKELLKKIRRIQIKTRGLSHNIFAGQYHSTFKGRGMTFAENREYQYGDDIRDIDWNVTARQNKPYIKTYQEERELTIMLLVDLSASTTFGATAPAKRDTIAEIAATLAFSATQNNDKVGALFFTDKIEKYIAPAKGKQQIMLIIQQLLDYKPTSTQTDISLALKHFTNATPKRTTAFLISDFIDTPPYKQALQLAQNKHDIIAIQIYDKRDAQLTDLGLIQLTDLETRQTRWIDTSLSSTRKQYDRWWYQRQQQMTQTLRATHTDHISVTTDDDYVSALMTLFNHRAR